MELTPKVAEKINKKKTAAMAIICLHTCIEWI